jgi:flagellar assembly protein FliH
MSEPQIAAAVAWQLPPIDGPVLSRPCGPQLDALEREAWNKGYAEGREAGILAANQQQQRLLVEAAQQAERLAAIAEHLAQPLAELDEQVQQQLVALAIAIARQLVRRELKTHPDEIVAVVREALTLLPTTARDVRVHVHPEDAALLHERLSDAGTARAWTLVEDPIMTRGGCRVTSENSSIDAQVERRLGAAVAAMLGDERAVSGGTRA